MEQFNRRGSIVRGSIALTMVLGVLILATEKINDTNAVTGLANGNPCTNDAECEDLANCMWGFCDYGHCFQTPMCDLVETVCDGNGKCVDPNNPPPSECTQDSDCAPDCCYTDSPPNFCGDCCGNGNSDPGEDCDEGFSGNSDPNSNCTTDCKAVTCPLPPPNSVPM